MLAFQCEALVEGSEIGKRMLGKEARRLRVMSFIKLVDRMGTQLFGGATISLEHYKEIEAKCMDAAKGVADDWHEHKGPCKVCFLGIRLEASGVGAGSNEIGLGFVATSPPFASALSQWQVFIGHLVLTTGGGEYETS